MTEVSTELGWIGVVVSIVFFGSTMVPLKYKPVQDAQVDPMVFQLYYSVAIFALNWLVLTYTEFHFTYWGIVGAALWVPASVFSIFGVKFLGLSVASGLWSGLSILVSFIWGAGYFRDKIGNPYLTSLGLVLLILGILVLASVKTEVAPQSQEVDERTSLSLASPPLSITPATPTDLTDEATTPTTTEHLIGENQSNDLWEKQVGELLPPTHYDLMAETAPVNRFVRVMKKYVPLFLGLICVICCGLLNGSMMVPNRFNTANETKGVVYLASFGIGVGAVTPVIFVLYFIAKRQLPQFHWRVALLPGLCTGTFWTLGNLGCTYAVLSPLGLTVGFPLTQAALIVSGLWAIILFREIRGWKSLLHFFGALFLLLVPGCVLLAIYGT